MALRCLLRLSNNNCSQLKASPVLSSVLGRNFSLLAVKNDILFHHHKTSINYANIRTKYEKRSNTASSSKADDDEDSDDETEGMSDVDKKTVVKINVQSMRADLLLKSGVGIARNKIEAAFYDGRIRLNGKKLMKKSHSCNVGDEIDYIKNESTTNPDHQLISRVEIMSATPKDDAISVTMRRFKSLTVEKKE